MMMIKLAKLKVTHYIRIIIIFFLIVNTINIPFESIPGIPGKLLFLKIYREINFCGTI